MKFFIERLLSRMTPRFFTELERGMEVSPSCMVLIEMDVRKCLVPVSIASILSALS